MNKIILISIVIFFAICSKSWALSECKGSPFISGDYDPTSNWNNCIGTLTWDIGSVSGEWKNGILIYGTMRLDDGDKYVGGFNKNKALHGQGTYSHSNGDQYIGEYKNGNMHGQGTYTYSPVSRLAKQYIGEFKDSKFHGQGVLTYVNGNVWEGQWKNGNFLSGNKFTATGKKIEKTTKVKEFKPVMLKKVPGGCYKEDNCLTEEEKIENTRQAEVKEKEIFENAKLECEAIGYKKGTEKFGECVLDLTE